MKAVQIKIVRKENGEKNTILSLGKEHNLNDKKVLSFIHSNEDGESDCLVKLNKDFMSWTTKGDMITQAEISKDKKTSFLVSSKKGDLLLDIVTNRYSFIEDDSGYSLKVDYRILQGKEEVSHINLSFKVTYL